MDLPASRLESSLPHPVHELFDAARAARKGAYVPYSRFAVGVALRTASGKIFHGFNIENASYGLTMCAERVALFAARAAGEVGVTEFALIAAQAEPLAPCGACRQVMAELAPGATVWMGNLDGEVRQSTVAALLPNLFTLSPPVPKRDKR